MFIPRSAISESQGERRACVWERDFPGAKNWEISKVGRPVGGEAMEPWG